MQFIMAKQQLQLPFDVYKTKIYLNRLANYLRLLSLMFVIIKKKRNCRIKKEANQMIPLF